MFVWFGLVMVEDVKGFVFIFISLNECDLFWDEGFEFYCFLLWVGVFI